jgi:hypothetical protein
MLPGQKRKTPQNLRSTAIFSGTFPRLLPTNTQGDGLEGVSRRGLVIWQPNHKGFSASHWQPGTCGAYDSLRLDCSKSLLGVQISIPGSDRVRPPWRMGFLRQFPRYSCTSASSSPRSEADLRPCRAFSFLFASSALCAGFAFKLVHTCVRTERLCEPQIDRVMHVSTEIGLAEVVRVIPDAQTDAALRI